MARVQQVVEIAGVQRVLDASDGGRKVQLRIVRLGRPFPRDARIGEIEDLLDSKVMLRLWVKVKSGWSDDLRALKTLGLDLQGDR